MLQNDLFDVLIRFRRNTVAVVCDISEMIERFSIFMVTHGSVKGAKLL